MNQNKYLKKSSSHWHRRLIHLSMMSAPIIYYWFGAAIASMLSLTIGQIILILALGIILFEIIRISQGWLLFAQREYERKYPSAFAWSIIGILMVLYFAPHYGHQQAAFGLPIIWSMCIGDPMLGEFRRAGFSKSSSIAYTLATLSILWLLCAYFLGTPWCFMLFMPGIAILAEMLPIPYVDDNFMMLILPLLITLAF
jgi:dolichol kinase